MKKKQVGHDDHLFLFLYRISDKDERITLIYQKSNMAYYSKD